MGVIESQPAGSPLSMLKTAMSIAVVMIIGIGFFINGERMPNENDPGVLRMVFSLLAVAAAGQAFWFASMARSGKPVHIVACAIFEVMTLFAFIYTIIDTEVSLNILIAAGFYSLAGIWFAVPNHLPEDLEK